MTRERVLRWVREGWPSLPFLAIGLIGTAGAALAQPDNRAPDVLAYLLIVVAALTVGGRRYPGPSVAVNGAMVMAYLALGYPYGPILLTVPAVIYTLAVRWPAPRAGLAAASYFGALIVAAYTKEVRQPVGPTANDLLWMTAVWGAIFAAAFALGATLRVRSQARAGVLAEQARRVASEERLRMAQDLHDSIGHGLAVIAMQTGIALRLLDRDPAQARESMEAVRATSRESLENLRAQLEAMRSPGEVARRPAPGLGDLERLTDRVRAGGVSLRVDVDADLPSIPSEVDAAAYRILQESLTNVLRHAGATAARISVRLSDGDLLLDVTNAGRVGAVDRTLATGGGSGIPGMRAVAESIGGTLRAGPDDNGGFAVAARLPIDGGAR